MEGAESQRPTEPSGDVFLENLHAFGGRAARLSDLAASGRLSGEECFRALTHLWLQLANAHRRSGAGAPGSGRECGGAD